MVDLTKALSSASPLLLGLSGDVLGRTRGGTQAGLALMQQQQMAAERQEAMRKAAANMGLVPQPNQPGQVTSAPLAPPGQPMSPAQALASAGMYEQGIQMAMQPGARDPASIQEYRLARQEGFGGTFQDWVQAKAQAGATRISNNVNTGAAGDEWQYGPVPQGYRRNTQTGQMEAIPGGPVEREATRATEDAVVTAQSMIDSIDAILNDEALPYSTGIFAPLQNIPGTGMYRFGARARQLQGQAFLQAFESLKGGGQITQIEGQKATEAIGRLDTAQSEEDYVSAMNDLRGVLVGAQERARQRAGGQSQAPAANGSRPISDLSDDELMQMIRQMEGQ